MVCEFEYMSTVNAMQINYEYAVAKLDGRAQLHKVCVLLCLPVQFMHHPLLYIHLCSSSRNLIAISNENATSLNQFTQYT